MFVRDRQAGTTERVSVDSSGGEANQDCGGSSISADGRFVVFQSAATNLVAGDANSRSDIFLHDRQTGTTELVSVDSTGAQGNGDSGSCVISADGSLVVFISSADNLVPGDTNGWTDVFVRDRQASTTERVSVDSSGTQADADCGVGGAPAISADGRYVAFQTDATNLVAGDTNGSYDIFVRDRQSGTTEIVSIDSTGTLGNAGSQTPCISADGRLVVFESDASNLIAADGNGWTDVFERDRQTGRTTRLSVSTAGGESSGPSYSPALSDDGRQAAFVSLSSDLIGGDANGWDDIYVRGRWLTLEAEPQIATAGATETLTTWSGKPLAPSVLVVIDVNGTPVFLPVLFGTFDAAGVESVSGTVPSGLSGNAITFATFGIVSTGKVQASNGAVVTFQ
jgi:Tol biopolymer transport system component